MQSFSTYRIVDRSKTIALFLGVAFRAPHESWLMGPEVLTIEIIYFATPLFLYQIWLACLTIKLANDATYDQHDFVAVPSGYEWPRPVL